MQRTESELAVSSGEGADSRTRASDRAISVATAVVKSVGEAQAIGLQIKSPNREQGFVYEDRPDERSSSWSITRLSQNKVSIVFVQ